jgi:hypothetical protein
VFSNKGDFKMKKMFVLLFAGALLIGINVFGLDYLKTVSKVTMTMGEGQPPIEYFSTSWLSPKGMRSDIGQGRYLLFRAEDSKFYLLYPDKKEYSVADIEQLKPMIAQGDMMTGDVTANGEFSGKTEKLGDWDTKVWNYTMTTTGGWTMNTTSWDSTKYTWTPVVQKYYEEFLKFQGKRAEFTKQLMKSDGMPMKMVSEMTMMGQKMAFSYAITEVSEEPVPDSFFEIPADYKEVPIDMNAYWSAFMF